MKDHKCMYNVVIIELCSNNINIMIITMLGVYLRNYGRNNCSLEFPIRTCNNYWMSQVF